MLVLFEQLWNGNFAPYKDCGKGDPEVEKLSELVERNKAALDHELSENQQKLLQNYMVCYDEYYYLMTVHAFRSGFSLAVRLLSESLCEQQ